MPQLARSSAFLSHSHPILSLGLSISVCLYLFHHHLPPPPSPLLVSYCAKITRKKSSIGYDNKWCVKMGHSPGRIVLYACICVCVFVWQKFSLAFFCLCRTAPKFPNTHTHTHLVDFTVHDTKEESQIRFQPMVWSVGARLL